MPRVHLKHESNGRTYSVTDAEGHDTGQRVYKATAYQRNVDLGSGNFSPYVWDEPGQSIRYSNKVCEFYAAGYQTIKLFGSTTLIEDQRFELQYWSTQGQGSWRVLDLYIVSLSVDQQDDSCIVTRSLSDGLGNTLDVDFLFTPFENVKLTFRLHVVDAHNYRIKFQNTGIAGDMVEVPYVDALLGNIGIYMLTFDTIMFYWHKDEIDIHDGYTVETQAGGKKLDFFLGEFDLPAGGDVVVSPTTWGETGVANTNDDCMEGSTDGVDLDGGDSDGAACGECDWFTTRQYYEFSARFQNVTIDGNPDSVDVGTQLEFDVGYGDGSFTPICYGLEGDTPAFNVAAPSTRTRTTASHSFTQPTAGNDRVISGANVQALIKEVLDTSWTSGYDIGLTFDNNDADGTSEAFQVEEYSTGTAPRITIVYTPAASGVDVDATSASLVITENTVALAADTTLQAGVDALTITENAAVVTLDVSVVATVDNLTLTENAAAIAADTSIVAAIDSLTLTENAVVIKADTALQASVDNLVITENSAIVDAEINVASATDSLTLTENVSAIKADTTLQAGIDNLVVTTFSASVSVSGEIDVQATTDALVLTENAATVDAEINVAATIDALAVTENQANISVGLNVGASIDSLILSALAAQISLDRNVLSGYDALVISEKEASVSITSTIASSIFKSKIFHGQESLIIN